MLALDDDEGLGALGDEDTEALELSVHYPSLFVGFEALDGKVGQIGLHKSLSSLTNEAVTRDEL